MKLRLVPEERAFYDLFRRDIANCRVAVTALRTLLHDFRSLKDSARKIHDIEPLRSNTSASVRGRRSSLDG